MAFRQAFVKLHVCVRSSVHIHIVTHAHIDICIYVYIYIYVYDNQTLYIHGYTYMHAYIHTYIYIVFSQVLMTVSFVLYSCDQSSLTLTILFCSQTLVSGSCSCMVGVKTKP